MDSLSISASVAGLLALSGTIVSVLIKLQQNIDDAPDSIQSTLGIAEETGFVLQSARNLLTSLYHLNPARRRLIEIDHLIIVVTTYTITLTKLQSLICPFDYDASSAASAWLRMKWLAKEDEISAVVNQLEGHKSSLSLLVNILQCESDQDALRSLSTLTTKLDRILEENKDMRTRLAHLEGTRSITIPSVRFIDDNASTIRAPTIATQSPATPANAPGSSDARISATFSPVLALREFETVLKASRVYQQAEPNATDMSFRSSIVRSHAWSALSGRSLADISVISVIALPLTSYEVKAMYRYLLPETELPRRGTINRAISAITRARILPAVSLPPTITPHPVPPSDQRPWKIAILGDSGVGKTAFAVQFCYSKFIASYEETIETAYQRYANIDGKSC